MLFLMLSETWLREHLDAEVSISDYTIHRADRNRAKKRRGRNSGGVAIFLRDDISAGSEMFLHYSSGVIEAIGLNVPLLNAVLITVYRQPNDAAGGNISTAAQFQQFLDELSLVLNALPSPLPTILFGGDFNLPNASWPLCIPSIGASLDERNMMTTLQELMFENFLHQVVDQPTHRGGNVLDLLMTNNQDAIMEVEVYPTAVSSHKLIMCRALLSHRTHSGSSDEAPTSINMFDRLNLFSERVDWTKINEDLSVIGWDSEFLDMNVSQMAEVFVERCRSIASLHAPKRTAHSNTNKIVPRDRRILMRKRIKLRKRLKHSVVPNTRKLIENQLTDIEMKLQESYTQEKNFRENRAVEAISSNSKYFYTYAKKNSATVQKVGPMLDASGQYTSNPSSMADILSRQYAQAFSIPSQAPISTDSLPALHIDDVEIAEEDFIIAINEISTNSAPGPDRFPAIMLKNCKQRLVRPLYLIWRKSLDTGVVPKSFKMSNITPIYKSGPRQIPKNYRPVALTSHLVKVFEKVIRKRIVNFLESNQLLNPKQHGFRAGRSCSSQLLQHFDTITRLLENGMNVDVVYLDFSKAFDKLDFSITLQKLHDIGITGKLHCWIKSFLTEREQCVVIQGCHSAWVPVISGVPQGSVIGPLLFIIMLNDIDSGILTSYVSSFADDTRVMRGIGGALDVTVLQNDLNLIYEWCDKNNAALNHGKFECLRYGQDESIKASTAYQSNLGTAIKICDSVSDLGVTVTPDACFNAQISKVCASANLKCGWILRTFLSRERLPLLTLWRSLVQPLLDYCCQLWSPAAVGLIQNIERVQASFLKKMNGMAQYDYWEQLEALRLYSQERRRERYIIIYTWKALEEIVPNFGVTATVNSRNGRYCSVPAVRSAAPHRIQSIRFNSMGVNGPRLFNCLPRQLRNMTDCSVGSFKAALDKHLATIPDEPRLGKLIRFCSRASNSLIAY